MSGSCRPALRDRAISPVVGVALLVVIVVVLAAGAAGFFLGLAEEPADPPQASLEFEYDERIDAVTISLQAGDTISAENTGQVAVVVHGNDSAQVTWAGTDGGIVDLASEDISASDGITLDDARGVDTGDRTLPFRMGAGDRIVVRWSAPDSDETVTLATDTVPALDGSPSPFGPLDDDGAVVTAPGGAVGGDGGLRLDIRVGGAQALGNTDDVDGDGLTELPYVDASGDLWINDSDGQRQQLVDRSAVASTAKPDADKTLLATASWRGSPPSVFYADADHAEIYRVRPGSGPTLVEDVSGNGANSVLGVGDIDGDDTDELVYADGSQEVRFLEPGGAVKTTGFTSGSNNGIGSGPLPDIDGDGTDEALIVDGSNDIRLLDASGPETKLAQSAADAAKSPVTATDVDDDGSLEAVFIDESAVTLRYVDDIGGSETVKVLEDQDGTVVDGDKDTGVVS